jgi:Tfp pilus assembly protein PilV
MNTAKISSKPIQRQAGLALVEIFVALLVLSVGLIALAKLQVDLVRGGGDSRARAAALAIAEGKIEDLRTFSKKQADPGVTWPVADDKPLAWSMIADNAGGRIAPSTINQAGVQYNLSWTSSPQATEGPDAGGSNESLYKVVEVKVRWTGPDDTAQTVTATASIPDTPPALTALASMPITGGEGPVLLHTPGAQPEGIAVPIDIGDGDTHRETSKPLPTVKKTADSTMVTFDVVNYNADTLAIQRREEFVTISCRCALAGAGPARTPARVAFTGNILRDAPGKIVNKTTGEPDDTQQPPLCNICCRDHHDYTEGADAYRYNPAADDDHDHYLFAPNGDSVINAADFDLASSAGDPYDEACRLKRINGVFQVFEDWNLATILAMPENDLTDASIQTAYTSYVQDLPSGNVPTFNSTTLVPAGTAQLSGRAIYVDHMPQNLIDFLNQTPLPAGVADNFLSFVPFVEINLTKLANWKLQDINTDTDYVTVDGQTCGGAVSQTTLAGKIACIANQAIVDETIVNVGEFQNYFRGLIKAGPVAGQLDAQVFARNGNTSITGTFPLTPTQAAATPVSAEYRFTVDPGQAISGQITKGANAPNGNFWSNITVTAASDCTLTGTGNSSRAFNCTVPTDWTGTVTASWPGHSFDAINNEFPPNALPASDVSFVVDP